MTPTTATLARNIMRFAAHLCQWSRVPDAEGATPLTERQAQLLAALEATTRPGVVAKAIGVTPSVVTGIVTRLEAQGLVRRATRGMDRRVWILELTEAGNAARHQRVERQVGAFSAALASLSAEELQTVVDTLAMLDRLVEWDA